MTLGAHLRQEEDPRESRLGAPSQLNLGRGSPPLRFVPKPGWSRAARGHVAKNAPTSALFSRSPRDPGPFSRRLAVSLLPKAEIFAPLSTFPSAPSQEGQKLQVQ